MKFGYARVSTTDQNLDLQIDALKLAQCDEIITDKISGTKSERPGLTLLRNKLRPGDTLAVWRLDRLGRSLKDLVQFVGDLEQNKIDFESLQDGINTKTATGKLTFHIFASLAEFERNLICERTKAGLEAARARGKKGGRKRILTPTQRDILLTMYNKVDENNERVHSIKEICETLKIKRPTLYKYLNEAIEGK